MLTLQSGADVVLNGASSITEGAICLGDTGRSLAADQRGVHDRGDERQSGRVQLRRRQGAHPDLRDRFDLIDQRPLITTIATPIDNDGTIRAEADGFTSPVGNVGTTTTGTYEATAGDL